MLSSLTLALVTERPLVSLEAAAKPLLAGALSWPPTEYLASSWGGGVLSWRSLSDTFSGTESLTTLLPFSVSRGGPGAFNGIPVVYSGVLAEVVPGGIICRHLAYNL